MPGEIPLPRSPGPADALVAFEDRELLLQHLERQTTSAARDDVQSLGLRELRHDLDKELAVLKLLLDRIDRIDGADPELAAARHQVDVIRAVLEGATEPHTQDEVDLDGLARDVTTSFGAAHDGRIIVETTGSPSVAGDSALLRRALVNLVDNARAAAPRGLVRVRVRTLRQGAEIEVEDDGSGAPRRPGSGIGLRIVRAAAVRHGGAARLTRSPLGGVRISLFLPSRAPWTS